ncbi:endolytic transglycosylase MltG [Microbacterium sp. P5_E9]
MPDSPIDDPFADLFGKLPDPRTRGTGAVPSNSTDGAGAAVTPDQATPAVPSSRRAARAAAATGATSMSPPPISAPIDVPAHAGAAGPTAAAGTAHAAAAARTAAPQSATTTVLSTESDPDDWPFAGANGAAPALPYSRTGGNRVITEQAPDATPHRDDFDDLFNGTGSSDTLGQVPPRPNKRRRRIGGWIALAVVLMLFGGVAAGGLWVWNTYEAKIREFMGWEEPKDYAEGQANGEALVTIASGDNGNTISNSLYEAGVTKTPDAFYAMLVDTAQNPTFYPGVYTLQKQMTSAAALAALQDPANKIDNTVVIPEGLIAADALQRIADVTGISLDELTAEAANYTQFGVPAEAPSIEGFLFPATYTFDPGVTAHDVLARMVNETFARLDALGVPESDRLQVLTLASVIQKESGPDTADMNKIARVFLNRIDEGMPFQSDATVAYGAGVTGTVWTTDEQRADESNIYNTYVHLGLPPGPISNPGEDAITGARNPADGNWLYFVAVNLATGETIFSDTYNEHLKAVDQLREWCAKSENASYCA